MPFVKPGNYFQGAKRALGNLYARGKQFALTADRSIRGATTCAQDVAPAAKELVDIVAPQYKQGLQRIQSGVVSGVKEYERMRRQIGSVAQAAEKFGGNPIGTNNFY